MRIIRPIPHLRNKGSENGDVCQDDGEPVLITKNVEARLELRRLLNEAQQDVNGGDRGVTVKTARRRLLG